MQAVVMPPAGCRFSRLRRCSLRSCRTWSLRHRAVFGLVSKVTIGSAAAGQARSGIIGVSPAGEDLAGTPVRGHEKFVLLTGDLAVVQVLDAGQHTAGYRF